MSGNGSKSTAKLATLSSHVWSPHNVNWSRADDYTAVITCAHRAEPINQLARLTSAPVNIRNGHSNGGTVGRRPHRLVLHPCGSLRVYRPSGMHYALVCSLQNYPFPSGDPGIHLIHVHDSLCPLEFTP